MAKKLMELDDVIGQVNIVRWFKGCIARDALPQVIMLQGPAGIGKTSIAKIVACEIGCHNTPDKLAATKKAVIEDNKSTDSVRLYNMSNLKSQDAVNEVKSDLVVGFSQTGRKVVIMDEAHGMSDEAQDSLLTTFESLQTHVYVIVCSTELDSFRDAFLSRCILRRLTNLSSTDMKNFLRKRIKENELKFTLSIGMVLSLISSYTGREPRRAINLLDSFEQGSTVSVDELETFFNVYEGKQSLVLVGYMYSGDILSGLNFIADMDIGRTFQSTLLDLVRVAQNGQTDLLDSSAVLNLRSLITNKGLSPLLGFAIDCTTHSRLTRNMVSGFFLKWCAKADEIFKQPVQGDLEKTHIEDIRLMSSMIETPKDVYSNNVAVNYESLESLLESADECE